MRIKVNIGKALANPHNDLQKELLEEEFQKYDLMSIGDLVEIGAKRLCRGIFLGIENAKSTPFSDENYPHVFIADPAYHGKVFKIPLFDIFFFEIVSRVRE